MDAVNTELLLDITVDELEWFLAESDTTTDANGITGPSRSPLSEQVASPVDSGVDKRTRRTEIERLSRRRRQDMLRAMRSQVKQLEMRFASLMAGHAQQRKATAASNASPHHSPQTQPTWQRPLDYEMESESSLFALPDPSPSSPSDAMIHSLRERFINATLAIQYLEDQQHTLRQMLRAEQLLMFSLQSLARTYVASWHDTLPLPVAVEDDAIEYTPLQAEEYFRSMRDAYEEMAAYDALLAKDQSGATYMGWHSRQHAPQTQQQSYPVSLTKTFYGNHATRLVRESWDLFSKETWQRQILGDWSDGLHCRVLHTLNPDMVVLYQTFQRRHVEKRFHSVLLLFRMETNDGFVLGTRTIPTRSIQETLTAPDKWTDVCTWCVVQFSSVHLLP